MVNEQRHHDALREIYYLSADQLNWRKLLTFGDTLELDLKRKLLWMWPTMENLQAFDKILSEFGIRQVLSVGCGNGLLEWLLSAACGHLNSIYGLEIDRNWWQSKYAVRSFIPLKYVEDAVDNELSTEFLINSCDSKMPDALLFCYFNNRKAFLHYLSVYEGKWLILMGPMPSIGIHTDPNPLQPHLPTDTWMKRMCLQWTDRNIVVFYEKLSIPNK